MRARRFGNLWIMTSTFCLTIVQFSSNLFDRNSPANDRPEMSLIGARLPPFHANSRFRSSPSPSLNLESKIKFLWLHAGRRGEGRERRGRCLVFILPTDEGGIGIGKRTVLVFESYRGNQRITQKGNLGDKVTAMLPSDEPRKIR